MQKSHFLSLSFIEKQGEFVLPTIYGKLNIYLIKEYHGDYFISKKSRKEIGGDMCRSFDVRSTKSSNGVRRWNRYRAGFVYKYVPVIGPSRPYLSHPIPLRGSVIPSHPNPSRVFAIPSHAVPRLCQQICTDFLVVKLVLVFRWIRASANSCFVNRCQYIRKQIR